MALREVADEMGDQPAPGAHRCVKHRSAPNQQLRLIVGSCHQVQEGLWQITIVVRIAEASPVPGLLRTWRFTSVTVAAPHSVTIALAATADASVRAADRRGIGPWGGCISKQNAALSHAGDGLPVTPAGSHASISMPMGAWISLISCAPTLSGERCVDVNRRLAIG